MEFLRDLFVDFFKSILQQNLVLFEIDFQLEYFRQINLGILDFDLFYIILNNLGHKFIHIIHLHQ